MGPTNSPKKVEPVAGPSSVAEKVRNLNTYYISKKYLFTHIYLPISFQINDGARSELIRGNNLEPPPLLLKAATIMIGTCGYIQIGFLPELGGRLNAKFRRRVVIKMNRTWIILDAEECHQFFNFLVGIQPGKDDEFPGNFFKRNCDEKIILLYVNYAKGIEYELIVPTSKVLEKIKSLNSVVNGNLFEITVLRRQIKGEIRDIIDGVVKKCYRPSDLEYEASNSHEPIIVELYANFFSFFVGYFKLEKNN